MYSPQALNGGPFKLFSPHGSFLGLLYIPATVADILCRRGETIAFFAEPIRAHYGPQAVPPLTVGRQVHFLQSHHVEDGIVMFGMEPENITKERGFAFIPLPGQVATSAPAEG